MLSPRGPRSVVPTAPLGAQFSALRDSAVGPVSDFELTNEAIRFRFVIIFESSST
jgi:hypothetical protein